METQNQSGEAAQLPSWRRRGVGSGQILKPTDATSCSVLLPLSNLSVLLRERATRTPCIYTPPLATPPPIVPIFFFFFFSCCREK
ncbi:hypothetical protein COEREDRAFT_102394 [Coemansia reversa NRRL 1564]|uniref:Uncharacterized protein n=1 Tax=Coemansia reversa (strain ATCC 12441 / NRRL 1564) TaxID=763665 RepID=A0A2G5BB15_COERN|nr:hypothetical protein COEREDRAFT_102394 [Coemansia reversa NRRL 1564]|eukprot:PIA16205.1 hypothetical protein COEREDRAFT_102394 [Coemansia reversa NRRL 1564]